MRYLKRDELHLVNPKFQRIAIDAWTNEEQVPYAIVALSDRPLSESEVARIVELNKKYNWE